MKYLSNYYTRMKNKHTELRSYRHLQRITIALDVLHNGNSIFFNV